MRSGNRNSTRKMVLNEFKLTNGRCVAGYTAMPWWYVETDAYPRVRRKCWSGGNESGVKSEKDRDDAGLPSIRWQGVTSDNFSKWTGSCQLPEPWGEWSQHKHNGFLRCMQTKHEPVTMMWQICYANKLFDCTIK